MKALSITALILLSTAFFGCQNELDRRYLGSSVGDQLELPPDLTVDQSESLFELPEVFSGDDENARDKVPVLAKVESMRVEGSEDLYWLSVEEPVDNLYRQVKNFWASEGYRLTIDEPVIGVMQTEWILKEVGASEDKRNWIERLFSKEDLSATQDQFRTRIERDQQGRSRIYMAHRGAEYKYVLDTKDRGLSSDLDENNWQFRQPDPELEIEMLSRLMVYLGLQRAQVDQKMANIKLFQPRAFQQLDLDKNSPFLVVKDPYQIAWNRVYHNLERMNFDIEEAIFKTGLVEVVGIFIVNLEVKDSDKQGGLFSLDSASETETRQIALILSEQTHELTRVEIETVEGELDTSAEGARFLDLLYQQLK